MRIYKKYKIHAYIKVMSIFYECINNNVFKYPHITIRLYWRKMSIQNDASWNMGLVHCGFVQQVYFGVMHYNDVIMSTMAYQITSLTLVYSAVYSDADQRKHQSSASLAFVRGIHREPGNSPHKWPVTRKKFPLDDVIMVFTRASSTKGD